MKKQISILLALLIVLAGCQNQEKKSSSEKTATQQVGARQHQEKVNLKTEWENLSEKLETAYSAAQTDEEREMIVSDYIESSYVLLSQHMEADYADTLFMTMSYMFSPEQKKDLFSKMPSQMLEQEYIQQLHKVFLREVATSKGNPYTDIIALQPNGDELSLKELVGKTDYVLVDFWASWCPPCRQLIPVLKEIYASQPKGRLQILSCSCDQDQAAWFTAMAEESMPWPQIREDGDAYSCSDLYGVVGIPTTILIDKSGMIIARNPSEAELEEFLSNEK